MDRPRILITSWRRPLATYLGERTVLDTLDPAYAAGVVRAGGVPLVLTRPPSGFAELVEDLLAVADGLLVSGGGDVDPANYGASSENVDGVDADADRWELALLAGARERALPTLAICRGAQLLAVAHHGRLAQRPSVADGHRELDGLTPKEILCARHPVELVPGSRVHDALGASSLAVNTIHHHQIAEPGELDVTGTSPGGVIEAIEPRSAWHCVGVQWHPEKMHELDQRRLFAQLVHAARRGSRVPA